MGSPLAPALANVFMGYYESKFLTDPQAKCVLFYKRYVDDIFCVFKNENEADLFFTFINCQHNNISFTMEKEKDHKLPFLDILIDNTKTLKTSVYHKPTYTGLLLNFDSFTPLLYKKGLVRTLVDRTYKITNTWEKFHLDIENLKHYFLKNSYPIRLIESTINKYLNKQLDTRVLNQPSVEKNTVDVRYYSLPYIGHFSKITQDKVSSLCKKLCKGNIQIKLAYSTLKIGSFFSLKDMIPENLKSFVVYKFECAGCNASYVGETTRHLSTRINEHLFTDKKSHIFKHLNESANCRAMSNENCFSVLGSSRTQYTLKLKEGIHIKTLRPSLNKQVHCIVPSI